jgi:hypothetical protein
MSVTLKSKLAIEGGSAVRTGAFAPWPYFAADEVEAAAAVLRSGKVNYWTGEEGKQWEREFAAYVGRRYAVALANGTVALELACGCLRERQVIGGVVEVGAIRGQFGPDAKEDEDGGREGERRPDPAWWCLQGRLSCFRSDGHRSCAPCCGAGA